MLKTMVASLLVVGGVFIAQQSIAADCMDSARTQSEINSCAQSKAKAASEMLAKLGVEIQAVLGDEQKLRFAEAQKAWENMVKNDCEIESSFYKGRSGQPMVRASCEENRANSRIFQTRYYLCPDWQMTGDCPAEQKYDVRP